MQDIQYFENLLAQIKLERKKIDLYESKFLRPIFPLKVAEVIRQAREDLSETADCAMLSILMLRAELKITVH